MHGGRSVGATAVKMGTGLAGLALAGTAAVALPGAAGAAGLPDGCTSYTPPLASTRVTCEFGSTGAAQTFHVPDGVTELDVMAVGGHGGTNYSNSAGGTGATVEGDLTVDPSSTLYVFVGGNGLNRQNDNTGGFNGGGAGYDGGAGGGGASDVRTSQDDLSSRMMVAAGGGGSGASAGGGNAGSAGLEADIGAAGGPGTDTEGGIGGNASFPGWPDGDQGSIGAGGASGYEGGGGGGGRYGGGGGVWGGGGGGSSLQPEGGTTVLAGEDEAPSVTISYTICTGSVCQMAGSLENIFGSLS